MYDNVVISIQISDGEIVDILEHAEELHQSSIDGFMDNGLQILCRG
jgi:hypothetical protein